MPEGMRGQCDAALPTPFNWHLPCVYPHNTKFSGHVMSVTRPYKFSRDWGRGYICTKQTGLKVYIYWRSERSHSQVIRIEICDIYMYSTYVRIYPPGGSHRRLVAAEWKVAGSSPAVELCFFSLFPFFPPLLFSLFSFSPLPSLYLSSFLFPLHARSATSMLKHFSSIQCISCPF